MIVVVMIVMVLVVMSDGYLLYLCPVRKREGRGMRLGVGVELYLSHSLAFFFFLTNKDLKGMDVLCTFKLKMERQKMEQKCMKDQ